MYFTSLLRLLPQHWTDTRSHTVRSDSHRLLHLKYKKYFLSNKSSTKIKIKICSNLLFLLSHQGKNLFCRKYSKNTKKYLLQILDSAININFVCHKGLTGILSFSYLIAGDRPQNWHRYLLCLRSVAQGTPLSCPVCCKESKKEQKTTAAGLLELL